MSNKFNFGTSTAFYFYTHTSRQAESLRYHLQMFLKAGKIRYRTLPVIEEDFYQVEHTTPIPGSYSVSIFVNLPSTDSRYPRLIRYCLDLAEKTEWISNLEIDGCSLELDHLREPTEYPDRESH